MNRHIMLLLRDRAEDTYEYRDIHKSHRPLSMFQEQGEYTLEE